MDEEEGVSVILVTGFLESGKTTFLRDAVTQEYFQIEDRTLLINCESGEEEYDPAMLAKYRTDYTEIDSEENFTPETLAELDRRFKPGRVLIEYNPLWGMQRFEEMKLPEGWEIIQQIGLVDSTTYVVYRTNMKSLFTEMAKYCELFIFNRASKEMPQDSRHAKRLSISFQDLTTLSEICTTLDILPQSQAVQMVTRYSSTSTGAILLKRMRKIPLSMISDTSSMILFTERMRVKEQANMS